MASLSELVVREGKCNEAEPLMRQTLKSLKGTSPNYWRTHYIQSLLGAVLMRGKQYAEAEPLLLSGYDGLSRRRGAIPLLSKSNLTDAGAWIVQLYRAWSRPEKAAEWEARLASDKADVIGRSADKPRMRAPSAGPRNLDPHPAQKKAE
jgi:eukaryotic-like serine/threonine-protein kinase